MSPFSIYAHIPWCRHKCPYCDFNVYAAQRWPEKRYVDALLAELRRAAGEPRWRERRIATIYLGGGTPSLFAPASVERLVRGVSDFWTVEPGAEITLEANPGTLDAPGLRALRAAGVTRLSLGIESFEDKHLRRLGRDHDSAQARAAIGDARVAGFDLNIDLMFAVPEQTLADWEADLRAACDLRPGHLSAYNLTYEEGTPFSQWRAAGRLRALPDEVEAAMFVRTQEILADAGYEHYEVSNYALPGERARHNSNYWRRGEYLGIGAGAHSFADEGWGRRWSNERDPERYMAAVHETGSARAFEEDLRREQAMAECVFLGLRQRAGIDGPAFEARFGISIDRAYPVAAALDDEGLLEKLENGGCRLTDRGFLLADSICEAFTG